MLAEASFAATAGVDLRLDDDDRHAARFDERPHGRDRLVDAGRDASLRDGDAARREQRLRLVLVDLHGGTS
jgi:hypothetical protein